MPPKFGVINIHIEKNMDYNNKLNLFTFNSMKSSTNECLKMNNSLQLGFPLFSNFSYSGGLNLEDCEFADILS